MSVRLRNTCRAAHLLVWVLLLSSGAFAAGLEWPAVSNQTKPWSRWWWMGSIATERDLTVEMEKYLQAGLGGLEITPIYGVRGYESRFTKYLTPEWLNLFRHALAEGKRLDLGMDMATGNGWPFGGNWVDSDTACRHVEHKKWTLSGGQTLSEPVAFTQQPMLRAIGAPRGMQAGQLKEPLSANDDLQGLALEQVRFEKPLPLQVLMAYSGDGQSIDLTSRVDGSGRLNWTAPAGNWTLYGVFMGWHGKMVERAGPGGEGNVIDHFSSSALRRYLQHFDAAYGAQDFGSLRAYFNDSYEVDDASGESNWTPEFFHEFQQRRGYDLRASLPALFGDDTPDKSMRVISDYRETISDLLLDEFTIPWREWAAGKGALIRNQAHGSPANILDLYAASGIPETEGSDILKFQFASSAAHVTGKPLASAEAATWLDEHFQGTLGEAKEAVDLFFLGGINHICYHGTTFSLPEEQWPGWMFYASVHFGPSNSFWGDFSILNQYVTRAQSFLQAGKPANDVLLYFPIYDRWSDRGRETLQHFAGAATDTSAGAAGQAMLDAGYSYDFVSDRQVANVQASGGALTTAGIRYKTIVLPETKYIPVETLRKVLSLASAGATVVVHKALPGDVAGWANLDRQRAAFRELTGKLQFTAMGTAGTRVARLGGGRVLMGDNLVQLLADAGVPRETMASQQLGYIKRDMGDGSAYFVLNRGNQAFDGWVTLATPAEAVGLFNPMNGEAGVAAVRAAGGGLQSVYLQLAPGESRIARTFADALRGPAARYWRASGDPRPLGGNWALRFLTGGPQLPAGVETAQLGSWTNLGGDAVKVFSGTASYSLTFDKPAGGADGYLLSLGRVAESARVTLNGREIAGLIQAPFQVHLPAGLLRDTNTVEVAVSNLMANRIIDLEKRGVNYKKFYNTNFPARRGENRGPDGNFTAARWELQESGLVGPVTLTPLRAMTPDGE